MRLVDGEQRYLHPRNGLHEARAAKSFRRDVQQIIDARPARLQPFLLLARRQRAVDVGGGDTLRLQGVDLVLHQGDERRDDQRAALAEDRRQLKAKGLAAAGRHHRQDVAPRQHRFDNGGLAGAKIAVPETCQQDVAGSAQGIGCCHGSGDSAEVWKRAEQTGAKRRASIAQQVNEGQCKF